MWFLKVRAGVCGCVCVRAGVCVCVCVRAYVFECVVFCIHSDIISVFYVSYAVFGLRHCCIVMHLLSYYTSIEYSYPMGVLAFHFVKEV
jgi:hypothetical protein